MKKWYNLLIISCLGVQLMTSCTENQNGKQKTCENVQLQDLDGNSVCIEDLKGKRVLLNLWATWCRPCVAEMPSLQQAAQILEQEGYVFLLASDEDSEVIAGFKNLSNFDLRFVQITKNYEPFPLQGIPTTLIYDSRGKLAMRKVGAMDWASPETLNALRQIP